MGEDRPLLIHVPEDYQRTSLRYPVLFHLYGQQVTNYFADAVMTADRLGETAEIPPMIVVGVANTDRYRDCLPIQSDGKSPGGADRFFRFFAEELIPFIDANYRTKPYRLLAGPQAGGALGLHALMTRPELFNAYLLRIENPFPGAEPFRRFFLDEVAGSGANPGLQDDDHEHRPAARCWSRTMRRWWRTASLATTASKAIGARA